jgi:hypothetical protein
MTIALLVIGALIGCVLGLAFAIAIVTVAGYDWRLILHRWHIEMVGQRYRDKIAAEIEELYTEK